MIENGFLIPYKGKYEEISLTLTHLKLINDWFYGLCDKIGENKALQILGYKNITQATENLSKNNAPLKMIENLGWIEISNRENIRYFISTGLEKELEIYKGGYEQARFEYTPLYEYKSFENDLSKQEFEAYLEQLHKKIDEDPRELITRGKYRGAFGIPYIDESR